MECELAEIGIACNGHTLLGLSPRQHGIVSSTSEILLHPYDIMAKFAESADDRSREVLVGKEAHARYRLTAYTRSV